MPSSKTALMGIINVTPNSFIPSSRFPEAEEAIERGIQMASEGADILDLGGEATSHSRYQQDFTESDHVPYQAELDRVIPVIKGLSSAVNTPISLDTRSPEVAQAGLEAGASILNDQDGFRSPAMRELAGASGCRCVIMHMQGDPFTMQIDPQYPDGVVSMVKSWLAQQIELLLQAGVSEDRIIVDPGIGFGKTVAHNYEILGNLEELQAMGFPVLIGLSRKSLMEKIIGKPGPELLPATLALHALLIARGVDVIRVHDVSEHRDIIDLLCHPNVAKHMTNRRRTGLFTSQ